MYPAIVHNFQSRAANNKSCKVSKFYVFREVNPSNYKNLMDKALYRYPWRSDRYAFALLLLHWLLLQNYKVLASSLEVWTSVLLYEFSLIFERFLYCFLWEMSYGHWDFLLNSLFYSSIIPSLLLQDFPGPFPDSPRRYKTRTKYYIPSHGSDILISDKTFWKYI